MDYQIVQQHEIQDIYRVQYGCLLKVNKYKRMKNDFYWADVDRCKKLKVLEKIKGIKNCYTLIDVYRYECSNEKYNYSVDAGNIIFEGSVIKILTDKKDFWIEIKFSGGVFKGSIEEYQIFKCKIDKILELY